MTRNHATITHIGHRRSKRSARFEKRELVEGLESRVLLTGTLIPGTNISDIFYDPVRNQLDVAVSSGFLQRYDAVTRTLVSTIAIGGQPGRGDITPDGNFIYLTDGVTKVNSQD